MIGFAAEHSGGEIRCDGIEIEDARWFSRDNLPQLPGHGSISRFIIEQWKTNEG
jgi:NAD+ diphosphatase